MRGLGEKEYSDRKKCGDLNYFSTAGEGSRKNSGVGGFFIKLSLLMPAQALDEEIDGTAHHFRLGDPHRLGCLLERLKLVHFKVKGAGDPLFPRTPLKSLEWHHLPRQWL